MNIFSIKKSPGLKSRVKSATRTTAYFWNDRTKTLTWKVSGTYNGKNVYKTIKAILGKEEKIAVIGKKGSVVFK